MKSLPENGTLDKLSNCNHSYLIRAVRIEPPTSKIILTGSHNS